MMIGDLIDLLMERGVTFEQEEIQNGHLLRCETGEKFAVYNTGRVVCQGKPTELSKAVKEWKKPAKPTAAKLKETMPAAAARVDKPVFIVYGHDTAAREGLELVLHKMGLEPIVLENLPADGDTIIY